MPKYLPKWLYHFAFPPGMNENSYCPTSSPAFGIVCSGFSSFLMTYDVERLSMCLFAICISFVICLLRPLAHFLTGLFSYCWVLRFLFIFRIIVLYQIHLLQIFSPSVAFFPLPWHCLCKAQVLNFNEV